MAGKKISLEKAKQLVKNHKDSPLNTDKALNSITYDANLIKELIEQPNCVGIRIFKAKTKVSSSSLDGTFVLVGVDAAGNNITTMSSITSGGTMAAVPATDAVIVDNGGTCPPDCDGGQGSNL